MIELLPRQDRELQGPAPRRLRRRVPHDRLRQGPEGEAARGGAPAAGVSGGRLGLKTADWAESCGLRHQQGAASGRSPSSSASTSRQWPRRARPVNAALRWWCLRLGPSAHSGPKTLTEYVSANMAAERMSLPPCPLKGPPRAGEASALVLGARSAREMAAFHSVCRSHLRRTLDSYWPAIVIRTRRNCCRCPGRTAPIRSSSAAVAAGAPAVRAFLPSGVRRTAYSRVSRFCRRRRSRPCLTRRRTRSVTLERSIPVAAMMSTWLRPSFSSTAWRTINWRGVRSSEPRCWANKPSARCPALCSRCKSESSGDEFLLPLGMAEVDPTVALVK